jgi:acyl-CoA oxidase
MLGNTCRERCGGQGYLSINRIDSMITLAHAQITAEGDSAVLMQKVSKEYVDDFSKNILAPPSSTEKPDALKERKDIYNITTLVNLIKLRETALLKLLTDKTVKNTKSIYNIWMLEESDLIQDLAHNFGERMCLEETIRKMEGSL